MPRSGPRSLPVALAPLLWATGCAPTLDVLGVYFPAWLLCATAGGLTAYLLVWGLGRRPSTRSLADSGLFFVSVALAVAFALWWIFFSGF